MAASRSRRRRQRRGGHEHLQQHPDGCPAVTMETGTGLDDESLEGFLGIAAVADDCAREPATLTGEQIRITSDLEPPMVR